MLQKIILFVLLTTITFSYSQNNYKFPTNAKTILFIGNSITYDGRYISYLETIYTLENPNHNVQFINVGLPSETISGLSEKNHANGKFPRPDLRERLKRTLDIIKPDYIFINYGINDGIFMPFSEKRFNKYKKGTFWLDKQIKKRNIPVTYITNSTYDKIGDEAYSNVMDIYANWLMSLKYTHNWKVIDIHKPMNLIIQNNRKTKPSFKLTRDGIHPTGYGHWIIAKQILNDFGIGNFQNTNTFDETLEKYSNGKETFKLVNKLQVLTKNAWLTHIGHKRPNMKKGMPLTKAKKQSNLIRIRIKNIVH